ncbi:MAG: DUF3301 domain-containing protein [Gammaproteobacteria bacterium]|nr:DUF3301 domain-containing protein [Gammaproteobacteria bacterium]
MSRGREWRSLHTPPGPGARPTTKVTEPATMLPLAGLLLLGMIVWAWRDTMRAREAANRVCTETCAGLGARLLDDTVSLRRLRLQRNRDGHLQLTRVYGFEYSDTGENRRQGTIVMAGAEVQFLHMEAADRVS